MSTTEEKLFARKSSGLIKEANATSATSFSVFTILGSKFGWPVAYLGLFPVALVLGVPPYILAWELIVVWFYLLGIIYVQITTPMPRSGADYVIPSRIMGPFWGWINSWMIVCGWVPIWAWLTWVSVRNIKQLVDVLRIAGVTQANIAWLLTPPYSFIAGLAFIIASVLIIMLPPRMFYRFVAACGIFAIGGLAILLLLTPTVNPTTMAANMQSILGTSTSQLMAAATKNGFDPNASYDWISAAGLAGWLMFGLTGFQSTASAISGELRGNVKRTLTISTIGSLTLLLLLPAGMMLMINAFGYNLLTSWSYLFWNARSLAPFQLPPLNALLMTVAMPNLWPLWVILALAAILGAFMGIPAEMLLVNRFVLAWGMDRMMPKSYTEVHPRLRQPLKAILIEGIVAAVFYAIVVYFPDFNPINYVVWSTVLALPSFIFPGIVLLLYHRRKPDLAKSIPWRKWALPIAFLWLVTVIPFYAWGGIIGSVPPMTPGLSLYQYAWATGWVGTVLAIVLGIIIYYAVKSYNLKRGIKFDEIYRTIPPE